MCWEEYRESSEGQTVVRLMRLMRTIGDEAKDNK